jgi:hypothetical protein
VTGYEIRTATSASSSSDKSITVDCTGSKVVVGGGATVADTEFVVLVRTYPVDSNTWEARAVENDGTNDSWTVTVYAICVN